MNGDPHIGFIYIYIIPIIYIYIYLGRISSPVANQPGVSSLPHMVFVGFLGFPKHSPVLRTCVAMNKSLSVHYVKDKLPHQKLLKSYLGSNFFRIDIVVHDLIFYSNGII